MAISWAESAGKHGVPIEDALHAMMNAHFHREAFDEPRVPGGVRPDLFIGPPRALGGPLLEIMAEVTPPRGIRVFHVMEARQKFLDLMEEDDED
ncbi:hypothetical protein D1871_15985 [Nakamurella silvestris]|nr:hypothetical protein D1871_15985 [Nakamurella silvestris]